MKYGLPYKGSKNKLAERILRLLPPAEHLIDLFCGGCAVSHAALIRGKYPHVHINDINWQPVTLFMDVLAGRYQDENRWISREDFFRLKDSDPYVSIVWSFGNNMRDYLYGKDIEPLKRAIHYALYYSDYAPAAELGHDLSFIDEVQGINHRYPLIKQYFSRLGHFQQQSTEGGGRTQHIYNGCKLSNDGEKGFAYSVKQPYELQHKDSRKNIQGMFPQKKKATRWGDTKSGTTAQPPCSWNTGHDGNGYNVSGGGKRTHITSSVADYTTVQIPKDSVIYCDIPYKDTSVYDKDNDFDYDRFYDWAEKQTEPVFISSYEMPQDRFRCIEEFRHRSILSATANNAVTERIFIPIHQKPPKRLVQLSLFE